MSSDDLPSDPVPEHVASCGSQAVNPEFQRRLERLRFEQNMVLGILGGALTAMICAMLWAAITVVTEYQIGWMAIGIGFLVGLSVRYFGRGVTTRYGVIGVVLALLSCLVGNLLSIVGFIAKENSMSVFQVLFGVEPGYILSVFPSTLAPMDLLFYFLVVVEAYPLSFIKVDEKEGVVSGMFEPLMRPEMMRLRVPVIIVGALLLCGGFYGLPYMASGPVTYTFDSGKPSAQGELLCGKPEGLWNYYFENGTTRAKLNYEKGILDSTCSWWNEQGKLVKTGSYWHGLEHGRWQFFDEQGNKRSAGSYQFSRQQGKWEYWHPDGTLSQQCFFVNGRMDSTYCSWFSNGKPHQVGAYRDDEKTGIWQEWDSTGARLAETRFVGDTLLILNCWDLQKRQTVINGNGTYVVYYPDGKIHEQGPVARGKPTGVWRDYYVSGQKEEEWQWENGRHRTLRYWAKDGTQMVADGSGELQLRYENDSLAAKGLYKNGFREGQWVFFDESNGLKLRDMVYVNGVANGPVRGYFESGEIGSKGMLKNDVQEGEWVWFHENQKPSTRVTVHEGKKSGTQTFWDENGRKIREEIWRNGMLLDQKNHI
jgi:antitoxin component YwqK of YwqJK toxin-antitoxin module